MQVLISSARRSRDLRTKSGSARKGRAIETMSHYAECEHQESTCRVQSMDLLNMFYVESG
jgi:hypothetical protein